MSIGARYNSLFILCITSFRALTRESTTFDLMSMWFSLTKEFTKKWLKLMKNVTVKEKLLFFWSTVRDVAQRSLLGLLRTINHKAKFKQFVSFDSIWWYLIDLLSLNYIINPEQAIAAHLLRGCCSSTALCLTFSLISILHNTNIALLNNLLEIITVHISTNYITFEYKWFHSSN